MLRLVLFVVSAMTLAAQIALGACTLGDIEWAVSNTNGNSYYRSDCVPAATDFTITLTGTDNYVRVRTYSPDPNNPAPPQDVGRVFLTQGESFSSSSVRFYLRNGSSEDPVAADWGGIYCATDALRSKLVTNFAISGDLLGSVLTGTTFKLDIGGLIRAKIESSEPDILGIECGGIAASGSIEVPKGFVDIVESAGTIAGPIRSGTRIESIVVRNGDLSSQIRAGDISDPVPPAAVSPRKQIDDINVSGKIIAWQGNEPQIYAPSGEIGRIYVTGDIGAPGQPVSISCRGSYQADSRLQLLKGDHIYANYTTTADTLDGIYKQSEFGRLECNGFTGSLRVGYIEWYQTIDVDGEAMPPGVYVNGDLDADIILLSTGDQPTPWASGLAVPIQVTNGVFKPGRRISMTGAFTTGAQAGDPVGLSRSGIISVPADGLGGWVMINNRAIPAGGGWNAPVVVGGTTLTPGPYPQTSAQVGGGTAAAALWGPREDDSTPHPANPVQEFDTFDFSTTNPLVIRFRGPVTWRDGVDAPPSLLRHVGAQWVDVGACMGGAGDGSPNHVVKFIPPAGFGFPSGEYLITQGGLKC